MLNEPHTVLEVCRIGQPGSEESLYGRKLYPGGQSRPGHQISCCHLLNVNLLTSPTGLARTYFCGSAMLSSYGSQTCFTTRSFNRENRK